MDTDHDTADPTPEDLLLQRVVDRGDAPADWDDLDEAAATDPALWRRLAERLRDDAWVRAAVAPSVARAEAVGLPGIAVASGASARGGRPVLVGGPPSRWIAVSGWIAALLLACLWLTDRVSGDGVPDGVGVDPVAVGLEGAGPEGPGSEGAAADGPAPDGTEPDGERLRPRGTADRASDGVSPVDELPVLFVRADPTDDGRGLRILTMRRILEERVVDPDLVYELEPGENGDYVPVAAELASLTSPQDF